MCNLCTDDTEEKKAVVAYHRDIAARLRSLAHAYDDLASGATRPHTQDAEVIGSMAKSLIRELVEWI